LLALGVGTKDVVDFEDRAADAVRDAKYKTLSQTGTGAAFRHTGNQRLDLDSRVSAHEQFVRVWYLLYRRTCIASHIIHAGLTLVRSTLRRRKCLQVFDANATQLQVCLVSNIGATVVSVALQ
jgi:hypothetical protein